MQKSSHKTRLAAGRENRHTRNARQEEWQKDDPCLGSTRTFAQSGVCERSGSTGKSVRGVENQLARTRLDYHSLQISDCRYVDNVFENLRQKLSLMENADVLNEKTNVLIWGLFMSTTMKASIHLGPS